MLRIALLLLSALVLAAAAPSSVVGVYQLSGVREAAGGLELSADGRFSYGLSYGALDETAEGKWRQEGNRILLTTDPKPRPATWELVNSEAGDPKVFALILENPKGQPIPNFTVIVRMNDGSEERGQTLNEWLEADLDTRSPVSVQFQVPVFDLTSPLFAVDLGKARRYRYRFDPADTGTRDFQDWPLEIKGELLSPPDAPAGQGFRKVDRAD